MSRRKKPFAERGQTSFEFLIATLLALVIILGVIQVALLFNAHSMVKLAAFNAARAAIVARGDNPTDPVTLAEMKEKAKLAAFLTVLPVIPSVHALLPSSFAEVPGSLTSFLSLGFEGLGERALTMILEYLFYIDVKFVAPDVQDPATADEIEVSGTVEFDDRDKADENLIKVLVTWRYPLVIPFVNHIMIAAMRPEIYLPILAIETASSGGTPEVVIDELVGQLVDGDETLGEVADMLGFADELPVWALGTSLDKYFESPANRLAGHFLERIPVRATYVMRMQWDRTS